MQIVGEFELPGQVLPEQRGTGLLGDKATVSVMYINIISYKKSFRFLLCFSLINLDFFVTPCSPFCRCRTIPYSGSGAHGLHPRRPAAR